MITAPGPDVPSWVSSGLGLWKGTWVEKPYRMRTKPTPTPLLLASASKQIFLLIQTPLRVMGLLGVQKEADLLPLLVGAVPLFQST